YFSRSLTAYALYGGRNASTILGSQWATIDGEAVQLDAPAKMIANRVMVPTTFVARALGGKIAWDAKTKTLTITAKNLSEKSAPEATPEPVEPDSPTDSAPKAPDVVIETHESCNPTSPRYKLSHSNEVRAIAASPDGRFLATGSWRMKEQGASVPVGEIKLWDAVAGKGIREMIGHWAGVNALAFSPDGKTLASASQDKTILLWNTKDGVQLPALAGKAHDAPVIALSYSTDGQFLYSGGNDGVLQIWNLKTNKLEKTLALAGHRGAVRCYAFSDSTDMVVTGGEDQSVRLWNLETGAAVKTVAEGRGLVTAVAFSPDGTKVSSAGRETVWLWDIEGKATARASSGHNQEVKALLFSAEGNTIFSAAADKTISVWNPESGATRSLNGHKTEIDVLALLPGCRGLASGDSDGRIIIWK
ncbi:MAG TPA: stalk domain-containing protein, partial [Abditibacteriaceae bacterium]